MIVLMVAVGAAVGAPARYLTDRAVQRRRRLGRRSSTFPLGTLVVNVVASFVLGVVTGAAAHVSAEVAAVIGTGFCGALSTFSTFSFELVALTERGRTRVAVAYAVVSVVVGVAVAAAGRALGAM